jgi:cytochrome c peroxidase
MRIATVGVLTVLLLAPVAAAAGPDRAALRESAASAFGQLPSEVPNARNPITEAKIELGRKLYYDPRLSLADDISCNSCHGLDRFGVDGNPTSPGHGGQLGGRNSPTVYNAALHIAQFWDGRAADVEEQAKGPILNPVEMAMPSEAAVIEKLRGIDGYAALFAAAFPGEADPLTYDNLARAIGAFERRLLTPGPLDRFLAGDLDALTDAQATGLETFLATGCTTCHSGVAVGGGMYQKLGLVHPYDTADTGREQVTGNAADRQFFKVPSLRNVRETAPYFHDGKVATLDEAIRLMGWHQLGLELDDATRAEIAAFLGALTGEVDAAYTAEPELP